MCFGAVQMISRAMCESQLMEEDVILVYITAEDDLNELHNSLLWIKPPDITKH